MDIGFVVISILLVIADGLIVHGPSDPLVVPLGSSVVLPCYVDEPLPVKSLEVNWRRTDSETQVHLFVDGESRPEVQQQDYHDRAHFFTEQIQRGNFSLLLENLTAEDEGKYTCKVYSQDDSGETVVQIKYERLLVSGPSHFISAYVGDDVTLNCSVNSHITPEHIEEVSWKKTDEDEDILVLLYQNNKTLPDSGDEQFRDRVEFFPDEIPKGNFSLRMKSVRTEDKGVYMCQVFAGGLSANAIKIFKSGFLSFCVVAASGSALVLTCLIYCRSNNTVTSSTIWHFQVSLVVCPNIFLFFAFIFWGLTEGFLPETITSCAFNILRTFILIWSLSYLNYLEGNLTTWIRFSNRKKELAVFTAVVYSAFFIDAWEKSAHDETSARRVMFGTFFGFVMFLSFVLSRGFNRLHIQWVSLYFLSLAQFLLLISSFGLPNPGLAFLAVPMVQSILLMCMQTIFWRLMIPLYIILVVYVHVCIFGREKEYLQWTCLVVFLEVLRIMVALEDPYYVIAAKRQQKTQTNQHGSNALPLCYKIMHMFGAVGLVLLNSVSLTAEMILKGRNCEHVLKDLRVIVFVSQCVFASYWMFLQICAFLMSQIQPTSTTRSH